MAKRNFALIFFIIVSVFDIIGIASKNQVLIQFFKPLILPSLLTLYALSVANRDGIYVLALVFSFLGDVFLLFSEEMYFILGLISFLVAHILFIKLVLKRIQKTKITTIITSIIPFLFLFISLLSLLYNSLNEMLLPVIIYGFTISLFGTVALIDYLNSKSKRAMLMLIGASVFIVSDSILAINKFYVATEVFAVLVMVTYVTAQYFIYKSMVLSAKEVSK